jgi:hypothetical protein
VGPARHPLRGAHLRFGLRHGCRPSPAGAHLPVRGAHAKGSPQALISRPPPLGRLPEPPCPVRSRHRKPNPRSSAAAVGFLPPPSLRRREVAKKLRKEVSSTPAPQVVESVLHRDQKTSPEFKAAPPQPRRDRRSCSLRLLARVAWMPSVSPSMAGNPRLGSRRRRSAALRRRRRSPPDRDLVARSNPAAPR